MQGLFCVSKTANRRKQQPALASERADSNSYRKAEKH
jgi:hypothetical protein